MKENTTTPTSKYSTRRFLKATFKDGDRTRTAYLENPKAYRNPETPAPAGTYYEREAAFATGGREVTNTGETTDRYRFIGATAMMKTEPAFQNMTYGMMETARQREARRQQEGTA